MLEASDSNKRSCIWASLTRNIAAFAKESGLVQRISKHFDPEKYLLCLMEAASTGRASINQLVASVGRHGQELNTSPQALHKRMNRTECGSEGFLVRCIALICSERSKKQRLSIHTCPFGRIVVVDSTTLRLPKGNAHNFAGNGNGMGQTAGSKVDLAFDLLGGEVMHSDLYVATQHDKATAPSLLDQLLPNDLVVRDMGYFNVEDFAEIERLGAFWLSRLPLGADVVSESGVPLEKSLSGHPGDTMDLGVIITQKGHHGRLVAIRASEEEVEKRRRERRKEARSKGRTACKKGLIRDGWHLMVTNVPVAMQSVDQLTAIYSQRWLIEMAFRAWKQAGNMIKALDRVSSPQHLKSLMLAGVIGMVIGMKIGLALARSNPTMRYSLEKVFDVVIARLVTLENLSQIADLKVDPRHLQGQKRRRKSLNCRLMELLG